MPYPNEHSARLEEPDQFDDETFRRTNGGTIFGDVEVPETIGIIWAKYEERNEEDDPVYPQALRFPIEDWTENEAREWLDEHNIDYLLFEPASGGDDDSEEENARMPDEYVQLTSHAALQGGELEVDREEGVIEGVSIISEGPAIGHPFDIDETTLEQVARSIRVQDGVKARLEGSNGGLFGGHGDPGVKERIGQIKNPRIQDGKVRADLHMGAYAKSSPAGDLWDFVMDLAEDDDARQEVGFSIVFAPGQHETREGDDGRDKKPAARLQDDEAVMSADIVDDPGANPEGFLSRGAGHSDHGGDVMQKELRSYLEMVGLDEDADAEEALEFYKELDGEQASIAARLAEPATADGDTDGDPDEDELSDDAEKSAEELIAEYDAKEKKRFKQLRGLADKTYMDAEQKMAWVQKHWENGTSVEEAKDEVLDHLAQKEKPVELGSRSKADPNVRVGRDRNRASLGPAITDAIMLRAGQPLVQTNDHGNAIRKDNGELDERSAHERAQQFRGLSLVGMGRRYLSALGVPGAESMGRTQVADHILQPLWKLNSQYPSVALAQSTADFPSILGDTINKSLRASYEEATRTWDQWAREATAPDYKEVTRASLSGHPDLRNETEITYVTMSDTGETYKLATYKGGVRLTREAVINDDLDAFSRLPRLEAAAARRKEDDVCYSVLTANENMDEDGNPLFGSAHENDADDVASASTGAPSTSTLSEGRQVMRTQTGPEGTQMNIVPRYLIVPAALETEAKELVASQVKPGGSNNTVNIFQGTMQTVVESRLDADSASTWYLAAENSQIDTVEVCFLEGERVPQTNQETDFDTGDSKFKVRHTVAAKAIDFRGLFRNTG